MSASAVHSVLRSIDLAKETITAQATAARISKCSSWLLNFLPLICYQVDHFGVIVKGSDYQSKKLKFDSRRSHYIH